MANLSVKGYLKLSSVKIVNVLGFVSCIWSVLQILPCSVLFFVKYVQTLPSLLEVQNRAMAGFGTGCSSPTPDLVTRSYLIYS